MKSLERVAVELVIARANGVMVGEGLHKAAHDLLLKRLRSAVEKMDAAQPPTVFSATGGKLDAVQPVTEGCRQCKE